MLYRPLFREPEEGMKEFEGEKWQEGRAVHFRWIPLTGVCCSVPEVKSTSI